MYHDLIWKKPKHSTNLFSFIAQSHSFDCRKIDRHVNDYFKIIVFQKKYTWKMEVLQIFGSWNQEIDSWFTNQKPLI